MILIELKQDEFTYCGKTYTQKRYVTEDMKFLISYDLLDWGKAYAATKDGKAERMYITGNENGNTATLEGIRQALEQIDRNSYPYTLNIHPTQFKNNNKPLLP